MKPNPPIILAAHGSRETPALETFRRFDSEIRQAFREHSIIWTFAGYILQKLRADSAGGWTRNIYTADELTALNLTKAIVQPLTIVPAPLPPALLSPGFASGKALLGSPQQIGQVAAIIATAIADPATAYILCGHGSKKHPERNQPLIDLCQKLAHDNVFMATLDGPPGNGAPLEAVRASGFKKAHFIPVMFASGMHVQSDVMGDAPESWKSRLGLPATAAAPLGDNPQIIELYIQRIRGLLGS